MTRPIITAILARRRHGGRGQPDSSAGAAARSWDRSPGVPLTAPPGLPELSDAERTRLNALTAGNAERAAMGVRF